MSDIRAEDDPASPAPARPFHVGERFSREIGFDAATIRAFAALVGDSNPLHHDEALAARSRFGRLIASGTQTSALMMAVVADHMTARTPSLGLETACQFKRAVTAGTALIVDWTVIAIERAPRLGGDVMSLEGRATDAHGTLYATAQAKTLLLADWDGLKAS